MKAFHSDFVCRVAGLPISAVEALRAPDAMDHVMAILRMERALATERAHLSDELFPIIGQVTSNAARGHLLRLRRDLHNGRTPSPTILRDAHDVLPSHVMERVHQLLHRAREHATALAETNTVVDAALATSRQAFQQRLHNEDFLSGVLLSSDTLYQNIARYCRTPVDQIAARDEQIERGLLRYFSRMATKGTPFGRFCAVLPGRIEESSIASTSDAALIGQMRKQSFVRLNRSLFAALWQHLTSRDAVRNALYVDINPTVSEDSGRLVFLAKVNGLEAFQRLGNNEVLTLVREMLASAAYTFGALVQQLGDQVGEGSSNEVRPYLDRLIEIGFIRFRSGISQQDVDWDQRLVEVLTPVVDDSAQHIVGLLTHLRECVEAFQSAPIPERRTLLQRMRSSVDESGTHLGLARGLSNDLPCYEDSTADCTARLSVGPEMDHAFGRLAELLRLTSKLSWIHNEQAMMRRFFEQHYGSTRDEVPLLAFYEDVFRGYMKDRLERERRSISREEPTPAEEAAAIPEEEVPEQNFASHIDLPVVAARKQALGKLREWYTQRLAEGVDAEEITLRHSELADLLSGIPGDDTDPRSLSMFCNVIPSHQAGGGWRLFVGSARALMGFGKYFSRFLYMFPPAVRDELEASSTALSGDRIAEICDDGGTFNGNLHPPLLSWELDYPTYAAEHTSSIRLPSFELAVRRSPTNEQALQLVHVPSSTRVWPVDLGFQNPLHRPALFQLLSRFQPASAFVLTFDEGGKTEKNFAPGAWPMPGVAYRPRISYEGSVVIARRRWLVSHTDMPQRLKAELDGEYFLRVNRWRCFHDIPDRVFVRVNAIESKTAGVAPPVAAPPENGAPRPPAPNRKPARRDHKKPQFIDFTSPMFVSLFARIAGDLSSFVLAIEECLPDGRDGWRHCQDANDDVYSAECMIQLNSAAAASTTPLDCAWAMMTAHE